jgi:hypothetical protein
MRIPLWLISLVGLIWSRSADNTALTWVFGILLVISVAVILFGVVLNLFAMYILSDNKGSMAGKR